MRIPEEQIYAKVKNAVAEALRIEEPLIKPDSSLSDDLGAESLDFLDIAFRLEQEFNIQLLKGTILGKASELLGTGAVVQNEALTELGADLLRRRMPEIDSSKIAKGLPLQELNSFFTVKTWVRAVSEVLDAKPTRCFKCNSEQIENLDKTQAICRKCEAITQTPTGEDLAKEWILKNYEEIRSLTRQGV